MNNDPNEKAGQQTSTEQVGVSETVEGLNIQAAPATAEEIVAQVESQAAKAADAYDKKAAPVAPQQDRIQLIDTKPKLHAVKLGGVTMNTEKKENENENTKEDTSINATESVPAENNTPPNPGSKKKTIGLFLLFGGLMLLVIFLPDISEYISTQQYLRSQKSEEKITTGILECKLEDSSDTLDYDYTFSFNFVDNKLTRLKSVTEIRGDVSLDESELDELKQQCDLLEKVVTNLSGVSVSCKLENGLFVKRQTFNFSSIVVDDAITAYIEAGGTYPSYNNGDDIDNIEKGLISTNYNCKRTK